MKKLIIGASLVLVTSAGVIITIKRRRALDILKINIEHTNANELHDAINGVKTNLDCLKVHLNAINNYEPEFEIKPKEETE